MKYFRDITDEELGARIKANHEKYLERVALQTPQWIQEGIKLKEIRERRSIIPSCRKTGKRQASA